MVELMKIVGDVLLSLARENYGLVKPAEGSKKADFNSIRKMAYLAWGIYRDVEDINGMQKTNPFILNRTSEEDNLYFDLARKCSKNLFEDMGLLNSTDVSKEKYNRLFRDIKKEIKRISV